jgi:hypothetical protein
MYNFTQLAVELNEPEENIAPTDSRLRPDQRLMENARFEEDNQLKFKIDAKHRARLALIDQGVENYKPNWFKKSIDKYTNEETHVYNNEYWECKKKQDWKRCPDIFTI